jgi:FdhD protein
VAVVDGFGDAAVSAAVLAGGASRRMGRDKRSARVAGSSLLRRAVDAVLAVSDDVQVVISEEGDRAGVDRLLAGTAVRVTTDARVGAGPLAGLETALEQAREDLVLVVAADHPELVPDVLRSLIGRAVEAPSCRATALGTDAGAQPLVAVYRRTALPVVSAHLDSGRRRAVDLLDALDPQLLEPASWRTLDPEGRTARDVDTPADLAAYDTVPDRADRTRRRSIVRVRGGSARDFDDVVVAEDPLEIRACGPGQSPRTVVTTMRTRGHDVDLAAGWLHGEGLLRPGGIERTETGDPLIHAQPDDQLTIHLSHPLDLEGVAHRHTAATASCGICGRASIDELGARASTVPEVVPAGGPLPWATLAALPDRLRDAQDLFTATGAIHATGLFTPEGELTTLREDIGRHNALDAAIGHHVRTRELPLHDRICVLSGRVGFELVAKAAVAGLPIVAAVGAPSELAVRTAERFGITLVGFLRAGDGNVYTAPQRLDLGDRGRSAGRPPPPRPVR